MFNLIEDQNKQSPPTLTSGLLDPVTPQPRASSTGSLMKKNTNTAELAENDLHKSERFQVNNTVIF